MDARSGFQRNYFIFINEDTGYEVGQKPSGHVKLEVRDGRGRLHAAVQNLRPGNGRFDYALYLFCTGSIPKTPVFAGNFESRPGKAELEWTFDPSDVSRSGVPIEGFDVFAVIAESAAGRDSYPACPLAAYRNRRVEWKNDFRMSRMVKKFVQPEIKPLPEFIPKPVQKVETKPETKPVNKPEIKPETKPEINQEIKPENVQKTAPAVEQKHEQKPEQAAAQGGQPSTGEPVQAGDQTKIFQAQPAPGGDQGQIYQAEPSFGGGEAQLYQYEPMQQAGQFYGAGQEQQFGQGAASQVEQAQTYMPYQFYQEQPVNTYDPYQMYQQPYQAYSPFQAYVQQPVQPSEPDQLLDKEEEQKPQEFIQPSVEPMQFPEVPPPVEEVPLQQEAGAAQIKQPIGSEPDQEPQYTKKETQILNTEMQTTEPAQDKASQQSEYQYPAGPGNLYTGCLYLNGNICGAILNTVSETASPCDTCKVHRGEPAGQVQAAGDLSRLRAILDLNFEVSDPFHSKRRDYEWWKITNPVNLNNILYQNNIRSPLMFNPAVMLAHYKYHHLIVGIFTRKDGQSYVVCGVPGMHMVDRKPFGDISKWVQADGGRSRYGVFGYWLVYINPDDGKILNVNQE